MKQDACLHCGFKFYKFTNNKSHGYPVTHLTK